MVVVNAALRREDVSGDVEVPYLRVFDPADSELTGATGQERPSVSLGANFLSRRQCCNNSNVTPCTVHLHVLRFFLHPLFPLCAFLIQPA
jgi:hypothetical protein